MAKWYTFVDILLIWPVNVDVDIEETALCNFKSQTELEPNKLPYTHDQLTVAPDDTFS